MPIICCICQNDLSRGDNPDASAFAFPMDKVELQQWLDACGPMKPLRPKNPRNLVCEDHFREEDFAPTTGNESSSHKVLHPGACPMAFIGPMNRVEAILTTKAAKTTNTSTNDLEKDPLRIEAAPKKAPKVKPPKVVTETKRRTRKRLKPGTYPIGYRVPSSEATEAGGVSIVNVKTQTDFEAKNISEDEAPVKKKVKVGKSNLELVKEVQELKQKIRTKKQQANRLKNRKKVIEISKINRRKIVEEELSQKYSATQISGMLRAGTRAKVWCEDDVKQAYGIYAISPKAYEYMRQLNLIALPSRSILSRYAANGKVWTEKDSLSTTDTVKLGQDESDESSCNEEAESSDLDTKPGNSSMQDHAMVDPRMQDHAMGDPSIMDPRMQDPRMVDPRMLDTRMMDPRMQDPRMQDPRMVDPRMVDPRMVDPKIKDPRMETGHSSGYGPSTSAFHPPHKAHMFSNVDPNCGGSNDNDPWEGSSSSKFQPVKYGSMSLNTPRALNEVSGENQGNHGGSYLNDQEGVFNS